LGVTVNWLQNRRQRVCIKRRRSSWIMVSSGVPQGAVLGHLLFLSSTIRSDILLLISPSKSERFTSEISSNVLKFADDTKIFREVKDNTDCSILQRNLDKLVSWSQKWQIYIFIRRNGSTEQIIRVIGTIHTQTVKKYN